MNVLSKILKLSERIYLASAIDKDCPSLTGLPFEEKLSTYIRTILRPYVECGLKAYELPPLAKRAISYLATASAGEYYAALLLVNVENDRLRELLNSAHDKMHQFEAIATNALSMVETATAGTQRHDN